MRGRCVISAIAVVVVSVCALACDAEEPAGPVATDPGTVLPVAYESSEEPWSAEGQGNGEFNQHHRKLIAEFEDGVVLKTDDDEFELAIRILEQTDFKYFSPRDQMPARPGVYIPRFRAYFEGHITSSYGYELSLQRSVEGAFDILDANINFQPSEEFQIKIGRFIVPYSYDWYDHLEQFFIAPERGLYPLNFGLSREAGVMFWGRLNDGEMQYALGGFSGQLSGLADTNTTRDLVGYLNFRPLRNTGSTMWENLNLGGSAAYGDQAFAGEPLPLRTSLQSSENDDAAQAASSVFLEYEEDVEVLGKREQAALHLAWYYEQLSFESEVQVGRFGYEKADVATKVPVVGYNIALSYFITGEEVTGRKIVIPDHPFNPGSGETGPGAIEPYVRYSYLQLGEQIFEDQLADGNDWTRQISMVDLGWNWYPNRYVKFYFDWQLSMYGSPVVLNEEKDERSKTNQLFWLRAQVFF